MAEKDYQEAYEEEHLQVADLVSRIAELEEQNQELNWKLNRIKKNPLWKASKPVRSGIHWMIRQKDRLVNCGGPRGVLHKLDYKKREKIAMKQYGTESFPSREEAEKQRKTTFPNMVKISILVPLFNTPREFLIQMLDSVFYQTYENWELCLADGSDQDHKFVEEICAEYREKSAGRLIYRKLEKNLGIAGNTNICCSMATGEYIGLFDHDDILHPSVLYEYVKAINEQNADFLYCDETTFKGNDINHMLTMHFKPDYAIDNLRANNYICHFSVFSRELLVGTELFRTDLDGSQDHDMILRLTDKARNVVHVPKLMYYWRSHAGSVASGIKAKPYAAIAARDAVKANLRQHGFDHFRVSGTRAFDTIFRIRYKVIGEPKVSIIIANKDHEPDLRRCLSTLLTKTFCRTYEVIIVENNSTTPEIKKYYSELLGKPFEEDGSAKVQKSDNGKITIVTYRGGFNYSAINNLGASYAQGEYLVLLNNDTQIITINWIEEMLMYAQREDVGAVGCKLYYGDNTIQHAGIVLGLGAHRTAGHSHYKQHKQNLGYMGRLCYAQNVSAVTGACLMVKKRHFDQVGGLDEEFAVSLNDVDFCLRLRQLGYLNVFTPFAEMYHYESISRGLDDTGERAKRYDKESAKFREKWKEVLAKGDPYYNPNFSLDRSDYSLRVREG